MFYLNYKTTLKNIVRSPAALLGIVGGIILMIVNGVQARSGNLNLYDYGQVIYNNVARATTVFLPAFVGIIIACDIYEEQKNRFCDLLFGGRMSFLSFYVSKILSYATVALAGCAVFTGISTVLLFKECTFTFETDAWHMTKMFAVRIFYVYTGGIITYLAVAVFFAAAFGKGSFAAIFALLYNNLYYVAMSFFGSGFGGDNRIGPIIQDYILHEPWKLSFYACYWGTGQTSSMSNRAEALTALGAEVAVGLALLIAAGFILRKRLKK